MTILNISLKAPAANGSGVPAEGVVVCVPTARHNSGNDVVLPKPFTVSLVAGTASPDLEPTDLSWVWRIEEHVNGAPSRIIYAAIPAEGPVEYNALVPVDPATLDAAAQPEPAWWAAANATINYGAVTGDNLILTRHDGSTVNAGNVRGPQGIQGVQGVQGIQGIQGDRGDAATSTIQADPLNPGFYFPITGAGLTTDPTYTGFYLIGN